MKVTSAAIGFWFLSAAMLAAAADQQYVISTYAGVPKPPNVSLPIFVQGTAADAAGNVYFTSTHYCVCIFKLERNGAVTRIAGNAEEGFSGDGGPATSALLNRPMGMAVDGAGNLFFADRGNQRIRKISPDGMIATVAGNGELGYSGDGGPAIEAQLGWPSAVTVDSAGNLFIPVIWAVGPRQFSSIRKVSPDGIINDAQLGPSTGVLAADGRGNLFIGASSRIHKVSPNGTITTVAGTGPSNNPDCVAGHSGDGGPATQAPLCYASSVAVDRAGNVFLLELGYSSRLGEFTNVAVRQVSPDGVITTIAGAGTQLVWGLQMAVDGAGSLFIADGSSVRKIASDGIITTVAGSGACCYSGDGGPATSAQLNGPHGVGVDSAGNLFIADINNHRIRKVTPDGIISTVAGGTLSVGCLNLSGASGPATAAQLCQSYNIAVDAGGNVFITDYYRIRKVSPDGTITSVAGNGTPGYAGDGGPAIDAQLAGAATVAVDSAGNLFIADYYRIRKVSPDGIITTIAGNGTYGYSGDGGPAIEASIVAGYASVTVDGAGNLFFVDGARIRRVSSGGIITTVAGNGASRYSGDGGPAIEAQISPAGVAVDGDGNLFIADINNNRIRRVSPDGIISTIAGTGEPGIAGDGGPAIEAQTSPASVAVDGNGNIYFSNYNDVVRILRPVK
jgi:sugar lactone lactonase YvrE